MWTKEDIDRMMDYFSKIAYKQYLENKNKFKRNYK